MSIVYPFPFPRHPNSHWFSLVSNTRIDALLQKKGRGHDVVEDGPSEEDINDFFDAL